MPLQEKKLHYELAQEGLVSLPANLPELHAFFVRHLLEDNQRLGGVGIKFEIGYFRSLHALTILLGATAAAVYAKYRAGGVPTDAEYEDLQDYLFFFFTWSAGLERCICRCRFATAMSTEDFYNVTGECGAEFENVLRDLAMMRLRSSAP